MLLGEMINRLEADGAAAAALEALGDLVLLSDVVNAGAAHDESPGEYVANGVKRFSSRASAEDWMRVMRALERRDAAEGQREALAIMVRWAVEADSAGTAEAEPSHAGCTCGGGGCGSHA